MESTTHERFSRGDAASILARPLTTSPKRARTRLGLVMLAIVLSILGFCFQGARGIWDPDEGRYVAIAMNMLSSGDYLIPRLDAQHEHFAKPPLTYWAIAMSLATFGHTEFGARLPSAVALGMGPPLLVSRRGPDARSCGNSVCGPPRQRRRRRRRRRPPSPSAA